MYCLTEISLASASITKALKAKLTQLDFVRNGTLQRLNLHVCRNTGVYLACTIIQKPMKYHYISDILPILKCLSVPLLLTPVDVSVFA